MAKMEQIIPSLTIDRKLWLRNAVIAMGALGLLASGVYLAVYNVQNQRAEIDVLTHQLARTSIERDGLSESLGRATTRIAALESDLNAAATEKVGLQQELSAVRERLQGARLEARDASADAETAKRAQESAARISSAALGYANASSDLSDTRKTMLNLCNDTFSASSRGLHTTAVALERQYNTLVPTHNRQLLATDAALTRLRATLRG